MKDLTMKPLRQFVICGITHKAFEILEGKMFIEFRGEPPKLPIYVVEVAPPAKLETPWENGPDVSEDDEFIRK